MILQILTLLLTLNVKVYGTTQLTYQTLVTREPDVLIVEEIHGIILDEDGHGRIDNGDDPHDYISYCNLMEYAKPGDLVETYCIYNPNTQYEDDIIYRIDLVNGHLFIR